MDKDCLWHTQSKGVTWFHLLQLIAWLVLFPRHLSTFDLGANSSSAKAASYPHPLLADSCSSLQDHGAGLFTLPGPLRLAPKFMGK